jgi:pimeloyl-ACP methyl ester carboxylesterase
VSRILLRAALGLAVVLVAAIAGGLSYRAWRQHAAETAARIGTPDGLDEARYVRLGGLDQWMTIRGKHRANPVLLMIDGGPGAAQSPIIPSPLEDDFTVVEWDQPGAGRTFSRAGGVIGPGVTLQAEVDDGIALAEHLRTHLGKSRIGVVATSYGTIVGVEMVRRRPDLFYAYVGTGQVVNWRAGEALGYAHLLAKAKARGDARAVTDLTRVGPPPYPTQRAMGVERRWASAYEAGAPSFLALASSVAFAPRYGLGDVGSWFSGFLASQDHFFGPTMRGPILGVDLSAQGPDFATPVFVFQGTDDDYTPFFLAKGWMDSLHAPSKLLVPVPDAGHYAAISHAEEFGELLRERVRPLGVTQ